MKCIEMNTTSKHIFQPYSWCKIIIAMLCVSLDAPINES